MLLISRETSKSLTVGADHDEEALENAQCVEHDFARRPRPQTLQHLVGLSSVS
jgi:hypothetical protein